MWWNLSRELLSQRSKVQGIPTLKSEHGEWAHAPADKADLIARTLDGKNVLPIQLKNQYSYVEANRYKQKGLKSLQQKSSAAVLQALCEQSGTGPDLLPARILKNCASQLAYPVLVLTLLILDSGEWPDGWKEHWVVPLFKRGAVFLP